MDRSVLEEKSSFKILGQSFCSKLDCGSYIVSIPKTVFKKSRGLIRSKKFLLRFYLYNSIKGVVYRRGVLDLHPMAIGPSLVALSFFYRYYFGRFPSKPAELVPLSHTSCRFTRYSNRLHIFFCHHF